MTTCARHADPTTRPQRGFVLVYVSVLGLLMMLIWGLAWRGTQDAIRIERGDVWRTTREESVIQAGAVGLELLSTGLPPSDPYECIVSVSGATDSFDVYVSYSSIFYPHTWTVDARLATDDEVLMLPAAPASF